MKIEKENTINPRIYPGDENNKSTLLTEESGSTPMKLLRKSDIMKITRRLGLVAVIGICGVANTLSAQSYFNLIYPSNFGVANSRYISQGVTGVANSVGYVNLWTNPAAMEEQPGLKASLNYSLRAFKEERSYPAIDMFEDKVTDNVYASNRKYYPGYAGGALYNFSRYTVGATFAPVWDMRYNYREEVRASLPAGSYNRDPVVGYHNIERTGQIYAGGVGIGAQLLSGLRAGAGLHFLSMVNGKESYSIAVIKQDDALAATSDTGYTSDVKLDGAPVVASLGLTYDINWRFRVGFNYRTGATLKMNSYKDLPVLQRRTLLPGYVHSADAKAVEIKMPGTISFAVRGKFQNPIHTTAQLEVRYTDWSKYSVNFNGASDSTTAIANHFQETFEYHIGVEHIVLDKYPFRFGFVYRESPLGSEFEQSLFTIGGSYLWDHFSLDIGAIFGSVTYQYTDIFPAVSQTTDRLETVNESDARVNLTLNWHL